MRDDVDSSKDACAKGITYGEYLEERGGDVIDYREIEIGIVTDVLSGLLESCTDDWLKSHHKNVMREMEKRGLLAKRS